MYYTGKCVYSSVCVVSTGSKASQTVLVAAAAAEYKRVTIVVLGYKKEGS